MRSPGGQLGQEHGLHLLLPLAPLDLLDNRADAITARKVQPVELAQRGDSLTLLISLLQIFLYLRLVDSIDPDVNRLLLLGLGPQLVVEEGPALLHLREGVAYVAGFR